MKKKNLMEHNKRSLFEKQSGRKICSSIFPLRITYMTRSIFERRKWELQTNESDN